MPLGWLVSVLVLLPNILFILMPPTEIPSETNADKGNFHKIVSIVEGVGRVSVFTIPFFYHVSIKSPLEIAALCVMVIALLLYYAGWVRYATKGRQFAHLFGPMLGIPVVLAVSPTIYFIAASVLLHSIYLAAAALLFGFAHIYNSYGHYKRSLCS